MEKLQREAKHRVDNVKCITLLHRLQGTILVQWPSCTSFCFLHSLLFFYRHLPIWFSPLPPPLPPPYPHPFLLLYCLLSYPYMYEERDVHFKFTRLFPHSQWKTREFSLSIYFTLVLFYFIKELSNLSPLYLCVQFRFF